MRKTRFGAVSLLILGMTGCGPAPTPQAAPLPTATVQPADVPTATATASAAADLSPVAEPSDIIVVGRWRNPMETVSNLASCAGIAPVLVEVNARMGVNMLLENVLRRSVDTRKIAGLVALDAPVDVVVSLDPGTKVRTPLRAISVGLTSLDGAKVAIAPEGQEPAEIAPGLWRVKGEQRWSCAVAASAGATPARLVCAERDKTVEALAPYLARTLPSVDLGGPDIHMEARVDVLRKRYGTSIQGYLRAAPGSFVTEYGSGLPKTDALLLDAATGMQEDVDRLFSDMHRITAELKSQRSGACLRATADVDLSSTTSWIAQTFTDRSDRSGPPPAIYWRQPKDSALAFYGRGVDPARFTSVLARTRSIVETGLAEGNFATAAERKKIADVFNLPFGKDTHVVASHGSINVPLPDPAAKGGPLKVADATFVRMIGWTLLGADEGPAAMKKQLKALVDAYKQGGVQSSLKKELGARDAKMLPVIKSGSAPASLGAGAEALEITMSNVEAPVPDEQGKPTPTMTLKLHVLVMGDGETSWMAIGASKDELVKRLLAAKHDADDKAQLSSRAGLESLKSGKQMFGGFVSAGLVGDKLGALLQHMGTVEPGSLNADDVKLGQSLLSLPNRGATPILLTTSAGANGASTRFSVALDVQQGTFEDTKALVISSYGFFSRMGLVP